MATNIDVEKSDLYFCQVCLEDQTERTPRLLSCHHSFCELCIKQLVKEGKVDCPSCRQVTLVDDVTKLSLNFMLLKIKEHIKQLAICKQPFCQMCKANTADKKCKECTHILCVDCIEKHNGFKGFKDHQILSVCPTHQEGAITHLCLQCVKAVCSFCIFGEHVSHQEQVVLYADGICNIKTKITQLKSDADQKVNTIIKKVEKFEELRRENENMKLKLGEIYKSYMSKARDIDEVLKQLKSNIQETSNSLVVLEKDKCRIYKMAARLEDTLSEKESTPLLTAYENIQQDSQKELALTPSTESVESFNIKEQNYIDEVCRAPTSFWQKARLLYQKTDLNVFGINHVTRIQCVQPNIALIIDASNGSFVTINQSGELKYNYPFASSWPIQTIRDIQLCGAETDLLDANSHNNDNNRFLYVLRNDNSITSYSFPECKLVKSYASNIYRVTVCKFYPAGKQLFLLFDGNLRRLYKYSTTDNLAKKFETGLNIDDLSLLTQCGETMYAITDSVNSKLHIYDENSCIRSDSNRFFSKPSLITVCPLGILVANKGGECIKLVTYNKYSLQSFEYHDLEIEGGIKAIVSMDYAHPYLWIAEDDDTEHISVKCFQLSGWLDIATKP